MSAETRYYYVDAQNQASGPIAMAGLLALKAAGTVTDATLVVIEGGTEWVAFSTLKAEGASKGGAGTLQSSAPATSGVRSEGGQPAASPEALRSSAPATSGARSEGGQPAASPEALRSSAPATSGARSEGGSSLSTSPAEPAWASQLSEKIDQLTAAMDKLAAVLEKSRPSVNPAPVLAPATAALHAEKINLNPVPKPGIASFNPQTPTRPTPLPAGIPVTSPKPALNPAARPAISTPLSPLAVPANAQKSPLPLPALGKAPGPAGLPKPTAPAPAKGNIFSKFIKK